MTRPEPAAPEPAEAPAADDAWHAAPTVADEGKSAGDSEPASVPAAPVAAARHRADPGAAARMFDAATTRRRSVVFEEDDELDVPDFLK